MKPTRDPHAPLPASSPRLAHGRYEVIARGPRDPDTSARQLLFGPHRFHLLSNAKRYAAALPTEVDGVDLIEILYVRPQHPRFPDGPWSTTLIADIFPAAREAS